MSTVYCFSSTGNSLYIAKKIANRIGADVLSMAVCDPICNDDVIGFVFPAYFWGLPKTVTDFISKLHIGNDNAYIFTVVTYGSFIMGVPGKVKELLKQKGEFYPAHDEKCDEYFTVADSCQNCGVCKKICPRVNIGMDNGKPIFKHDCELCLVCLHICPVQAINWKNKTNGKDRYKNPNITLKELTSFNQE